jgi:hypothetical protein
VGSVWYNSETMSTRLVTIATFDEAPKARLAQNALQTAGIQSTVADETLVAMDWLLSNAVGGVKVQVRDEDAERAVEALNEAFGEDGSGSPIDMTQLAAEAEAELSEDEPPQDPSEDEDEPPPAAESYSREDYARRMVFASLLGVLFAPVSLYAFYLLLNAIFTEGELSSRGRINLWIGGAFTLSILLWMAWILEMIF